MLAIVIVCPLCESAHADSNSAPPLTAEDLAPFLDGLIPFQMRQNDIAGKHCVQALGLMAAIATPIVIYDTIRTWGRPTRWSIAKVGSVVISVACLCLVAFALIWNLFDFSNHY